jgi:uncharacterized protein (TIGR03790 family)
VRDVLSDPNDASIAKTIIALAQGLSLGETGGPASDRFRCRCSAHVHVHSPAARSRSCQALSSSACKQPLSPMLNRRTVLSALLALALAPSAVAGAVAYPLSLRAGWNLLGNSLSTLLNVKQSFGAQAGVQSVWKWDAVKLQWAFYAPALDADGSLASYAASRGYSVLGTVNPGEGFWVNALAPLSLDNQSGTGFSLGSAVLGTGWNLVATADDLAPSVLAATLANVTSLWAWDEMNNGWYFYAPSLVASNNLASYIQSQGYRDFGSLTLGKGRGIWVNYAASPSATLKLALPQRALAPSSLAVIVAAGDPLSESIASYYQSARGLPAANIIRVTLATGVDQISASDFAALKAEVDAKLPANVQATLLTWTAPSRVAGTCTMSITSALALGFDAKYCAAGCLATASSAYYDSESAQPWTDHQVRPSMMLGASSLAAAKTLIDRGLRSDASQPAGDGYLLRTSDSARSVRYTDYTALPALWSANGGLQLSYIDNSAGAASDSLTGKSNVLFYFTGLAQVPNLASNSFAPGAAADHLTSFGGYLPNGNGQMPVTAWLDAGATASYGTVAEPCNYTQKFPRASVLIDQYYRGATLIEAYWKSVEWPGQGLFVGEPLAQPFRDSPNFTISGVQYLINTRSMRPNSHYSLEYRKTATSGWIPLASFTLARAQAQTVYAPLAPTGATQLRWRGPCASNPGLVCTLSSSV